MDCRWAIIPWHVCNRLETGLRYFRCPGYRIWKTITVIEQYIDLKRAIEAAGYFTTFMPINNVGDRMVCASHQYPKDHDRQGLHRTSFWVALRNDKWYLASWVPRIYCVGLAQRMPELCLRLLGRKNSGAYSDFDERIRSRYELTEISVEEFDLLANK